MNNVTDLSILACPGCLGKLSQNHVELVCTKCGPVGRLIDGLPCFADPTYYWGEIPREEMELLGRLAKDMGWRAAVETVIQQESLRQYICDPGRADFHFLWDLPPTASVLDVGAGWGTIASQLGRRFARVVAIEGVLDRARFIRTRLAHSAQDNVCVICADFLRLPLAPRQFDAVVLNGVLEWVGLATTQESPRNLQLRFLRRVGELLKTSGFVCLGIENRVGLAALRGSRDHSGLPFTSLMPRWAADLWCRWLGQHRRSSANVGYRTYTYSLPGYRRLLTEAGFRRLRVFQAWNGYNAPGVLVPLDEPRMLHHFLDSLQLRHQGWRGQVKHKLLKGAACSGLWKNWASDFVFLAEKG